MRILLFFLPTVVKVLDLENSLRNIQTDILNVESWNRESSEFPLDWPLQWHGAPRPAAHPGGRGMVLRSPGPAANLGERGHAGGHAHQG